MKKLRRPRRQATTDPANTEPADDCDIFEPETGPMRRCIVTRQRLGKEQMIRFVLGPDRMIVPDLEARLPGRGIWLSAHVDVVETAWAKGGLARSFARATRGPVTLPVDLPALLQASLVRRIADLLGLARRAGQAVSGFQKAREWLHAGRAGLVIQASDGSADERARFLSGVREGSIPIRAPLPGAELGRIFGRDHTVHVVISSGRLAETLANETLRLSGLRGETAPPMQAPAGAGAEPEDSGLQAAGGDAGTRQAADFGLANEGGRVFRP